MRTILSSMLGSTALMQVAGEQGASGTDVTVHNPEAMGSHIPLEVDSLIADLVIKQEDVKAGPIDLYFAFERLDMLDEFPIVGTSHSDEKKTNNPETFKDGKGQEHNYFTDWYRSTTTGMKWFRRIGDLKRAIGNEANLETLVDEANHDVVEHVADHNWLKDQKALYDSRLQNGRNMVRKTILIRDTLDILATYSNVIGVTFNMVKDKEGKDRPARTKTPVAIVDVQSKEALKPHKWLTLGDFLKFHNPAVLKKAQENGATYTGFIAAIERSTTKGTAAAAAVKLHNMRQAFPYIREVATFLDDAGSQKNINAMLKELAKPENDELVEAIGDLFYSIDSNFMQAIEGRYQRLKKARNASLGSDLQPNKQAPQQLAG